MLNRLRRIFRNFMKKRKKSSSCEDLTLRDGQMIKRSISACHIGEVLSHNARVVEAPTRELHLDGTPRLCKGSLYRSWQDIVSELSNDPRGAQ